MNIHDGCIYVHLTCIGKVLSLVCNKTYYINLFIYTLCVCTNPMNMYGVVYIETC